MATKEEISKEIERRNRLLRRLKKSMRMIVEDFNALKASSDVQFTLNEQAAIDRACITDYDVNLMDIRLKDTIRSIKDELNM